MTKWKKIIAVIMVLCMAAAGFGWYLYMKQPDDVRKQPADMELQAGSLLLAFQQNETEANHRYVDKILIVTGKVTRVQINTAEKVTLFLDTGNPLSSVICSFYAEETITAAKISPGTSVRVKGKCTGILLDVILNKCSLAE